MKSASTPARTEYILYDVVGGSRSQPLAKLEYSEDRGSSWNTFDDVKSLGFSSSNVNKQYSKFILVPPAHSISASFDNRGSKYSPGGSGDFANVLKRNLYVRNSFGYKMNDVTSVVTDYSVSDYLTLYHSQIIGTTIKNDVSSASVFNELKGIPSNQYDNLLYGSSTYSYDGYWLSNVKTYTDYTDTFKLTDIAMDSDSDNIFVYYRASDNETDLTSDLIDFISLGELASGSNSFPLPDIKEKYFQFVIVFATGTWGVGTVDNIQISKDFSYEYFDNGEYLIDTPTFQSSFGNYSASISGRDKFKKALETKVTCPTYSSGVDIAEILRDASDRVGISHDNGTELIADTGYTVSIADDDNFKNMSATAIYNECMIYLNWKNNNYRLEFNGNGYLQLVIKDSTITTADWQLDYRRNIFSLSKSYDSDNLLQRVTVMSKSHTVEAESSLVSNTYVTTQGNVDLTWSNSSIYKRVEYTVNSGDGVFTLNSTSNTGINFNITGSSINVKVEVFGDELKPTPPFIGESIFYNNAEYFDGITHTITNRLIQSDSDAKSIAEGLTDIYGNPEFKVSAKLPYNPLLELGDRLLIWEKYTNTNTIYRIDTIGVSYSADGANAYMTLSLTDLGSDFSYFNWDRNNVINGGTESGSDDLSYDSGLLWDQDLGVDVTDDTKDYSYLERVTFS